MSKDVDSDGAVTVPFLLGLIITAIAVGYKTDATTGWLIIGGGLFLYAAITAMIRYLARR